MGGGAEFDSPAVEATEASSPTTPTAAAAASVPSPALVGKEGEESFDLDPAAIQTPFELFVLEELLREMCDVYDRRLILYRPLVSSLLKEVEVASDAMEGVHKLVPLSDALYEFEMLIKEAQQCLLDVLDKEVSRRQCRCQCCSCSALHCTTLQ